MEFNKLLYTQVAWRTGSIGSALLVNILMARFLGAAVNGEVLYLFAAYSLVIQVTGLSMETGVAYYAATNTIKSDRLIGFSLLWSAAATIAVAAGWIIIDSFIGPLQYPIIYPLSFVLGNLLVSFGNAWCYAKLRYMFPNVIALVANGLTIALVVFHFWVQPLPIDMVGVWFFSYLFQGILLMILLIAGREGSGISFRFSAPEVTRIAKYGSLAFFSNLLFLLMTRLDYFIIREYCTDAELGNYAQASRIGQLFFLLPSMIATVIFPMAVSQEITRSRKAVFQMLKVLLLVNIPFCAVLAFTGHWLFPSVFGTDFSLMYDAFLLLIPGILSITAVYPFAAWFSGRNRVRDIIRAGVLALLVMIPVDLLLIPEYGINGAAAASSVAYMLYLAVIITTFYRKTAGEEQALIIH